MSELIPSIDVSALFGADSVARTATDRTLMDAAARSGFMLVRNLPADVPMGAAVAAYYRGMEKVANALMHSIARGLGLPERFFDAAFERGLSTLRFT